MIRPSEYNVVPPSTCKNCGKEYIKGRKQQRHCSKECRKQYAQKNRDPLRKAERQAEWIRENPLKRMLYRAKARAKQRGVHFDLHESDVTIPDVCPLLGTPFVFNKGKPTPYSPSLDRIVPELGYTKGNVMVISMRANVAKNDLSLYELKTLVENLEKYV